MLVSHADRLDDIDGIIISKAKLRIIDLVIDPSLMGDLNVLLQVALLVCGVYAAEVHPMEAAVLLCFVPVGLRKKGRSYHEEKAYKCNWQTLLQTPTLGRLRQTHMHDLFLGYFHLPSDAMYYLCIQNGTQQGTDLKEDPEVVLFLAQPLQRHCPPAGAARLGVV